VPRHCLRARLSVFTLAPPGCCWLDLLYRMSRNDARKGAKVHQEGARLRHRGAPGPLRAALAPAHPFRVLGSQGPHCSFVAEQGWSAKYPALGCHKRAFNLRDLVRPRRDEPPPCSHHAQHRPETGVAPALRRSRLRRRSSGRRPTWRPWPRSGRRTACRTCWRRAWRGGAKVGRSATEVVPGLLSCHLRPKGPPRQPAVVPRGASWPPLSAPRPHSAPPGVHQPPQPDLKRRSCSEARGVYSSSARLLC
jgi:hypothetical protein